MMFVPCHDIFMMVVDPLLDEEDETYSLLTTENYGLREGG